MTDRGEGLLYLELSAPGVEWVISELLPIVRDDPVGNAKPTHYVFPNELQYVPTRDSGEWLRLHSFSEIVYRDDQEAVSVWGGQEGSD